eukprot:m51a1_g13912 hypothetical protein (152) ;mRNA; r:790820-791736
MSSRRGASATDCFVVCISDTHGEHGSARWESALHAGCTPENTVLVHSGDFTVWDHPEHLRSFDEWIGGSYALIDRDRLWSKSLAKVVEGLPEPPHLRKRVHVSGHAHERHFVEEDVHGRPVLWVGASLKVGSTGLREQPVVVKLDFKHPSS